MTITIDNKSGFLVQRERMVHLKVSHLNLSAQFVQRDLFARIRITMAEVQWKTVEVIIIVQKVIHLIVKTLGVTEYPAQPDISTVVMMHPNPKIVEYAHLDIFVSRVAAKNSAQLVLIEKSKAEQVWMIVSKQGKDTSAPQRLKLLMLLISVHQAITVLEDLLQQFPALLELSTQKVVDGSPNNVLIVRLEHTATNLDDRAMALPVQKATIVWKGQSGRKQIPVRMAHSEILRVAPVLMIVQFVRNAFTVQLPRSNQ